MIFQAANNVTMRVIVAENEVNDRSLRFTSR